MKKTKNTLARIVATAAGASALLIAGVAQAALQDRDLDGDSVVDAFYDTDLDITWLRDAKVNGAMDWDNAVAWADGFSIGGYDDWRLPTTLQPDATCGSQYAGQDYGYNCTGSEMGHLWYVELGNIAGSMTNAGNFQNLQDSALWSGTKYAPDPRHAWYFDTIDGNQQWGSGNFFLALPVRPGDVPVVPEPQTHALLLAGLGVLALLRRKRTP